MLLTNRNLYLKECLGELGPYPYHSRIHPLKTFEYPQVKCFVKRDDELGFGISGSKIRKYLSLLPHLLKSKVEKVILIGSPYSNNIVGLTQLLIENNIQPILFLKGESEAKKVGNFLLTSMMVSQESIHWVDHANWKYVEQRAALYAQQLSKQTPIITEGASTVEALPGSLTLALDILANEAQIQKNFEHIFMDAGTGMISCATLLAFAWLDKPILIHVVQMAEGEKEFLEKASIFKAQFESLISQQVEWHKIKERLRLYTPEQCQSFGSTNRKIFDEIGYIARKEGFITDPIYSAKLFLKVRQIIEKENIKGNCLIIHSGGGLTLMGFQEQLYRSLQNS